MVIISHIIFEAIQCVLKQAYDLLKHHLMRISYGHSTSEVIL